MTETALRIHVLVVEDSDDDTVLIVNQLRRGGLEVTYDRVYEAVTLTAQLRDHPPDLVISDYNIPGFSADEALELLHDSGLDAPFILVSGQVGEETAAALMRAGAHDVLRKENLTRLAPAVQRELRDAADRGKRRFAEAGLRDSEQRFRLLAEHAQDVILRYRHAPRPHVDYLSPAAVSVMGCQPEDAYDNPEALFSRLHPDDRERFITSWSSPDPSPLTVRWCPPDGRTVWTEQRTVQIRDGQGRTAVQGILRDITEQTLANQERERLENQLRQGERLESLGRLAGGVAHDFNNLLGVITGYAGIIIEDTPVGDPRRPDAEEIRNAAERAAELTRQLLIFSHLDPAKLETFDLNAVVTATERLLRRTIGEDIEFASALEPGLPPVTADRGKVEQVIMNLVVNARGAMPSGGRLTIATSLIPTDAASRSIPDSAGCAYLHLTVTDTGYGMTADVVQHALEPFFTTKPPGEGTGIGLATVYGVVKEANGHIEIESQVGKGTTIHVYLPTSEKAAVETEHPTS